jgi:hypothetical protein
MPQEGEVTCHPYNSSIFTLQLIACKEHLGDVVASYTLPYLLINIGPHSCSAHVPGLQLYAPSIYEVLFHQVERTLNMYNCKKEIFRTRL